MSRNVIRPFTMNHTQHVVVSAHVYLYLFCMALSITVSLVSFSHLLS